VGELNDERVRFYLRHREQIEAWAALRTETASAIDDLLEQMAEDVDELATELDGDVVMTSRVDGQNYPHFLLHRAEWGFEPTNPQAAVGFEWARSKTFLAGAHSPYVGVRFDISDNDTRILRNAFRDAVQATRSNRKDKASPYWPCYRYLPADGEFWLDFTPYRAQVIAALRDAWSVYERAITGVLADEAT